MNRRLVGFVLICVLSFWWSQAQGSGADAAEGSGVSNAPLLSLLPSPPPPVNDNFANATFIAGGTGTSLGSNVGATKEVGEPAHAGNNGGASVWWSWTAPSSGEEVFDTLGSGLNDTLIAVYTGSSVGALTLINSDDDASSNTNRSKVVFDAVNGTTYKIAVDGYQGTSGTLTLNWAPAPPPPANDAFASAAAITGTNGTTSVSTAWATREIGEPTILGRPGGASVWWAWTAPTDGYVSFNTRGSDIDTMTGVYSGSSLNALTPVAATAAPTTTTFPARSGTTYFVTVDGYFGEHGVVILNWAPAPPPNDNFAEAITLFGFAGQVVGSNVGATAESGEPVLSVGPGASVWWSWTAPANGAVTIDTLGSDFNTVLGVFTGSAVNALTLVASNYDFSTGTQSRVDFATVLGTKYYILVNGSGPSDHGVIALRYTFTDRPGAPGDYKITYNGCQIAPDFAAAGRNLTVTNANAATISIQKLTKVPPKHDNVAGKVLYVLGSPGLDSLQAVGTIKSLSGTGAFIPTIFADVTGSIKMGVADSSVAAPSTIIIPLLMISPAVPKAGATPALKVTLTGVSIDLLTTDHAASVKISAKKLSGGTIPAGVTVGAEVRVGPGLSLGVTGGDMLANLVESTGGIKSLTVKGGNLGETLTTTTLAVYLTPAAVVAVQHPSTVVVSGLHAGPSDAAADGIGNVSAATLKGVFVAGADTASGGIEPSCDAAVKSWGKATSASGDAFVSQKAKNQPFGIVEHLTAP